MEVLEGIWMQDNYTDMGTTVYHDRGRKTVEVSLPHILNIHAIGAVPMGVELFNASQNYLLANFGNPLGVQITYTSTNPLIAFTYRSFLGGLLNEPMQIGLIRVQAVTQAQINRPLSLLNNAGVGKFNGDGIYPTVFPDQFIANVAYVEKVFRINDNLQINYIQNPATDANVQLYFYQAANIALDRAFSNEKIIQQYGRPQTGIVQPVQITAPAKAALPLRSSALL